MLWLSRLNKENADVAELAHSLIHKVVTGLHVHSSILNTFYSFRLFPVGRKISVTALPT